MFCRLFLFVWLAIVAHAQPGWSQLPVLPSDAEIRTRFAMQLPRNWSIDEFTIEEPVNYGTAVEPIWKRRYVAQVKLANDTFIEDGRDGPIVFLRLLASRGEKKSLYGIVASEFKVGRWTVDFAADNDPLTGFGNGRETFPGRTIVRGTEEEKSYWTQRELESQLQHKAELARRQRDAELAEQQRQHALAKAKADAQLEAESRRLAEEETERKHQAELARRRRETELAEQQRVADQARARAEAGFQAERRRQQAEEEERRRQEAQARQVAERAEEEKRNKEAQAREAAERAATQQRMAALEQVLATKDRKAILPRLAAALADSDEQVRNVALLHTIAMYKVLSGKVQADRGVYSFTLRLASVDLSSGDFRGVILKNDTMVQHRDAPISGQVSGSTVTWGGEPCTMRAQLDSSKRLVGRMSCSWLGGEYDAVMELR